MGRFSDNFQRGLYAFMAGRNGMDALARYALGAGIILPVLDFLFGGATSAPARPRTRASRAGCASPGQSSRAYAAAGPAARTSSTSRAPSAASRSACRAARAPCA